jgi:hypothetical protein
VYCSGRKMVSMCGENVRHAPWVALAAATRVSSSAAAAHSPPPLYRRTRVASRGREGGFGWEMSSRGHFATPADPPRHDGSPYRGLHVRRERLGFLNLHLKG